MENYVEVIMIVNDHLHVTKQNHHHLVPVDALCDMILIMVSVVRQ